MPRLLAPCCLTGLLVVGLAGSTFAQTAASTSGSTQDLVKQAIRASNNHEYAVALTHLDKALGQSPNDRDALDITALVASMASDATKETPTKIAYLQKAIAAFDRLERRYKPLFPDEVKLGDSLKLDPARIEVLQGQPAKALDLLAQLVADRYPKAILIDLAPDFESVRKLPDFKDRMAQAYQTASRADLADFKSFALDFDLKTVDGKPIHLADFKGAVTIVDIWGTWCPPCREEIPHLVSLANRFEARGLKVIGVNCNEDGEPAQVKKTINDFIAEFKIPYPCVLNDETIQSKVPDFEGYPTLLVLDQRGKVRFSMMGLQSEARLEALVTTLLAEAKR